MSFYIYLLSWIFLLFVVRCIDAYIQYRSTFKWAIMNRLFDRPWGDKRFETQQEAVDYLVRFFRMMRTEIPREKFSFKKINY